jgi:hypothetical protein
VSVGRIKGFKKIKKITTKKGENLKRTLKKRDHPLVIFTNKKSSIKNE